MVYHYNNFQKEKKAVALGYDANKDDAPKVVATGKGVIADQIINIAKSNNIPLHYDSDLVEILSLLEIDAYIPVEVYGIVADILSYIYQQNSLAKNR
jgi:flagellar biosynthesis protein